MKKAILITLFLTFTAYIYSQESAITYYENGQIKKQGQHNTNNLSIGIWKWFHKNGNLKRIGKSINGKQTGKWKYYDIEGKTIEIKKIKNGQHRRTTNLTPHRYPTLNQTQN